MNVFDTETNLILWKEIFFYNEIKLNFTDILAVAKEWLFHGFPLQPLCH